MRSKRLAGAVAALFVALVLPANALGAHHLTKIREVFPGSTAHPGAAFIELQLTAAGENQVTFGGGSSVTFYDAGGNPLASGTFVSNPPNGENQRTILAGCGPAEAAFGVTLDLTMGCAFAPSRLGGSACFNSVPFGSLDCVRWGAGTIAPAGTSASGTPEAAIPDGMSLTRSIAAGCSTLFEFADDTNDSAADFEPTTPTPRPNSVTPTETPCTGGGGGGPTDTDGDGIPDSSDQCPTVAANTANGCPSDGGGGGADTTAPQTALGKKPPKQTERTTALFKFSADEAATFQCKIDAKPLKPCTSPKRYRHLHIGKHSFQVVSTDAAGNADATPSKYRWKIVPKG
jgi:hypothetical protein